MDNLDHQLERYEPTLYSAGDTAKRLGVSVNMLTSGAVRSGPAGTRAVYRAVAGRGVGSGGGEARAPATARPGAAVSRYPQRRDPKTGRTYYIHRAVAEWHLGRQLKPGEVVHHENEIKQDDHPLNLRVFRSQNQHMLYHHYLRRQARGVQHLFDLETWLELHG